MLTDREIHAAVKDGEIEISPFDPANLQPCSYDFTLDSVYRAPRHDIGVIDVADVRPDHTLLLDDDNVIPIEPGDFILASTVERFRLGPTFGGRVEGRSSVGRLGVAIHTTAGFIDPGFEGQITLEIANFAPWEIHLRPGMRIGQIAFTRLHRVPETLYGVRGHYQGQQGPQESRLTLD